MTKLPVCILILTGIALITPASAGPNRDSALRDCNVASINRYSYHGTPYDKEQQRYDFYRACMFSHHLPE
jgi:hypothetical protein